MHMKAHEIIKDVFIVGGPEITDNRDGCVYLLNFGELVLIDTGAGWSVEKIINNINILGFYPKELAMALLTHCHIDHIGGAPEIKKKLGSKLCIHKLDASPLESGDPVLTAAQRYQTTFPPTDVNVKFTSSEEKLTLGDQEVICLHTPGHTPGSISILIDKDGKRLLFAQDIHGPLLKEFGSNLTEYDRSTQKLLDLNADILCEGHFGIYPTRKQVREYIRSCRRQYGLD
jgi:glyoxylase-like metal-dependent hydrolase (beta-lactamase superfamily II)